ncbi:HtaA domain-containing protein [Streptomyces sp. t39]|uniref:HtaA domain-containing protein n=1 Tax=Streptomyces sp. t39 TaxID=1828156 RepID=UPI0011CDBB45|nr:HtaA domain-containing protein [Streptomyces sp. t39]TXS51644.1 hypothetical protein EAO77_22635 [Streptomyces sp. t39]
MAVTRRPRTVLAAAVATAALGATAFAVPALAADAAPAAAPQLEIVDGSLVWGVKESFRKYLAGPIAQGRITVSEGARQAEGNGLFTFAGGKGTYDTATHASNTGFAGAVRFEGHHGVLDFTLSDIKVGTGRTAGTITADVKGNNNGTPSQKDDVVIADLDLTGIRPGQGDGGAMVFANIPATLTADGSAAFAGFYPAGTALDPATLSVKAAAPSPTPSPTPPPGPSPDPSTTPPTTPSPVPSTTPPTDPSPDPSVTQPAEAPRGTITDGNLDWGVKESFRGYVTGPIAKGKVELAAGAAASGAGYRFPAGEGTFDADAQTLSAEFAGAVRFLGHQEASGAYTLDLTLSGLEAEVVKGRGTLVADVKSRNRETHQVTTWTDLEIASLDLPDGELAAAKGVLTLDALPAVLTAEGAEAFAGFYEAGAALDPVTVSVSLDEDAELPGGSAGGNGTGGSTGGGSTAGGATTGGGTVGGGTGALASTGAGAPAGALLAGAGVIAAAGAAVVVAVRRRSADPTA